jgi:phosphoribosylformimino-5-aminoimidazole carboxamide ribotide isomerase
MRILPVIDLKGGVVVRGVAGRRDEYRPIESRLCDDPSPASVAKGLKETFGFDECYVADLDAIATGHLALDAYNAIEQAGFSQWIDAGVAFLINPALELSLNLRSLRRRRPILGLESITSPNDFPTAKLVVDDSVFSLDLFEGAPRTQVDEWMKWLPDQMADLLMGRGVTSLIVLDLAGVGVGQGVPTLDLCRRLRAKYPKLELTSGGGVRGVDDLKQLRDAGCDYALVASALHDGRLTPAMLREFADG